MGVGRGEEVCRKGCPYIRQLANCYRLLDCRPAKFDVGLALNLP